MLSLNLLLSREKIRLRDEKPELKRIILIEIREKKKVARVICPELFLLSNYAEEPIEDTRRARIPE